MLFRLCLLLSLSSLVAPTGGLTEERLHVRAEQTLTRLSKSLLSLQKQDGEWIGPIEADPSADVMPLILAKKLGLKHEGLEQETLQRIFKRQDAVTGLWPAYPGGPASADVTAMVLNGLTFAGVAESDPRVRAAWRWYRANGGTRSMGTLNKMISVFADIIPPESVPSLSTKFFALPKQSPINVFNVGFGRSGLIPLAVWKYYRDTRTGLLRPAKPLDPERLVSGGEAFGHPTKAPLSAFDPLHRLMNRGRQQVHGLLKDFVILAGDSVPTSPDFWAQEGLGWILKRQQADGTWAGALQITYFCMLALHEAELAGVGAFRSEIEAAWQGLMRWRTRIPGDMVIQQSTQGPVMDTARVLTALGAAPQRLRLTPPDRLNVATSWLLRQQILKPGDWSELAKKVPPGGWAFEYWNDFYPDTDDTGMVVEALASVDADDPRIRGALDRGVAWLKGMQNRDGGFPTWDRDTSKLFSFITTTGIAGIPDVSDKSQGDITARVLKGLAALPDRKPVQKMIWRACDFLVSHARPAPRSRLPLWQGEWMVNYTYGTAQAIEALLRAGCWSAADTIPHIRWLIAKQHENGGWGESPESYGKKTYVPAPPTLTQTEFVLSALIEYERARLQSGRRLPSALHAIERGVTYLVARLGDDEFPVEEEFTGVYVRGVWYGRYLILPHYEAVRVLGAYLTLRDLATD